MLTFHSGSGGSTVLWISGGTNAHLLPCGLISPPAGGHRPGSRLLFLRVSSSCVRIMLQHQSEGASSSPASAPLLLSSSYVDTLDASNQRYCIIRPLQSH